MEIKNYLKPNTLKEAYETLIMNPQNQVIGGGAWMKFLGPNIDTAIDLSSLGLEGIEEDKQTIYIGSMTSLYDVENHLAIKDLYGGILAKAIHQILGPAFRHGATIGGSIIGNFAFSDILTPLICMNVQLHFYKKGIVPLETFMQQKQKEKDLLLLVTVTKEDGFGYFKKVSNTPLDFAILNVAIVKNKNHFKIALGARPQRAELAMKAMDIISHAKKLDEQGFSEVADLVVETLSFGSNHLASETYRKELAKAYVIRGLKEVIDYES